MGEASPSFDAEEATRFLTIINEAASRSLVGAYRPGLLQLDCIHPAGGRMLSLRFEIGSVAHQVEQARIWAESGHNVYVEGRTVDDAASGRGSLGATRAVFGLVIDGDGDKGMAGAALAEPSLVVETSPGNTHRWHFLDRALTPEQAKPLGEALRAAVKADSDTGTLTQPYRVAGTPNLVGAKKAARGRANGPTRILEHSGRAYSAEEFRAAFPHVERAKGAGGAPKGRSGRRSEKVEEIVAETGDDRSARFHAAVAAAFAAGLTADDLEELMRKHPEGCGGKYLEPYDRLEREIERSWEKVRTKADEIRRAAEETVHEDASGPVEEARRAVEAGIRRFIEAATAHRLGVEETDAPPVHALSVSTGVGKTRTTARIVSEHLIARREAGERPKAILYAVPTHRLGDEIVALFALYGIVARVFRGRQAMDPDRPGQAMCDDVDAVEIALSMGEPVATSCCKGKRPDGSEAKCQFYASCSYQGQMMAGPDVWIVAHQMLFKAQPALGDVEMVVVDEGFWQTGIGIPKRGLTLDEIGAPVPFGAAKTDSLANDVEVRRGRLARALRLREGLGGVQRQHLVAQGLTTDECTAAISGEWALKEKAPVWPGMPRSERRRAAAAAESARHVRAFASLWGAARHLLFDETITASGRLYLDTRDDDDGRVLVAKVRSLRSIKQQWQAPTLLIDATLPPAEILHAFYPQAVVAQPIEAAMPHVRVRQVLDAPVSGSKLRLDEDGNARRNLRAVRREILRRFVELGRAPLLVIAQKAVADWLRSSGVPAGIGVEHFNNVAGLDRYKNVRGLMVIGRTIPPPAGVEALAGALTGAEPEKAERWYVKTAKGLRTRDSRPVGVECDTHPDPVAEACRWQICEGELMQAIGRARGVNRTAATPLTIDILADICLPLTVDEVVMWSPPGDETEMVAEGVILDSAADMAAAWPAVWPSPGAARVWLHRHTGADENTVTDPYKNTLYIGLGNGVRHFRYQRAGAKQKWRTGAYDPSVVPDIQAWLVARLGPLAGFEFVELAAQATPPQPGEARIERTPTGFVLHEEPFGILADAVPLGSCPRKGWIGGKTLAAAWAKSGQRFEAAA